MSCSMSVFAQKHPADYYEHLDSAVSLSLLTCQAGEESWSLYGHTAIHYVNRDKNIDVAVNYGMFNFHKPFFVLRFIFGLTDYEMGVQPYDYFCGAYAFERRGIIEQEINFLSPQDKEKIIKALEENYRPENREYRYNIFYDNCTTRARDMLLSPYNDSFTIDFKRNADGPSFRELTHLYTANHPWTQLGNDLLLGLKADRPTNVSEQQFLPFNLMEDFDRATISPKGSAFKGSAFKDSDSMDSAFKDSVAIPAPLMKGEKRVIVPMFDRSQVKEEFPLSPTACAAILAILIIIVTIIEYSRQRILWGVDLVLLILIGLSGLILTAMIFSQHPTVNLNLQILLLNPLALICLWPVVRNGRKGRSHWFWKAYAACLLLFLAGNLLQCYAEGTNILASSLLIHCAERIITQRNQKNPNTPKIPKIPNNPINS